MDPHRLAEERSLAYHQLIAERLRAQPELLAAARALVLTWLSGSADVPSYAGRWQEILSRDVSSIATFLVERSDIANELRQSTPFTGAISPRERWDIWRETRDRLTGSS